MQTNGAALFDEQRKTNRKVLKVKALLAMEGEDTVMARTADVGGDGMCVMAGKSVKAGAIGMVRFELYQDGKVQSIAVRAMVQYCIFTNGEFKIGFRFVYLDLSAMAAVARFLH